MHIYPEICMPKICAFSTRSVAQTSSKYLKLKLFFCTIGCTISSGIALLSIPFASSVLDAVLPLENGNRERIWPLHANYIFFDRDNHFYLVIIHIGVVCFSIMCLHIGMYTIFVESVEHACGLFDVVR